MARADRLWCLVRGMPSLLICHICIGGGILAATMLKHLMKLNDFAKNKDQYKDVDWSKPETIKHPQKSISERVFSTLWIVPVLLGAFVGYPFQVIGINVIYARFNLVAKNRRRFKNSFSAAQELYLKYGNMGFYRGFVPGMITYSYFYKDNLSALFFNKYFWEMIEDIDLTGRRRR